MESPILAWNASSWVKAGEKVLDSIPKPAMEIRGMFFSGFCSQLIKRAKEIVKVEGYAFCSVWLNLDSKYRHKCAGRKKG